jgi:hypothetical protein
MGRIARILEDNPAFHRPIPPKLTSDSVGFPEIFPLLEIDEPEQMI